ncbi:E3 ubiquitin/ISG15 ligase TRIM25-like [Rhinoderma darwinii]|uniref:E3 ubiquitin/ISG15 ligase TRIM25-like n=1 Tax=Rhinoderma darwinii TaxID=43563 RepID=UPI003F67C47D
MASADLKEDLTCSICLIIYTDPVTLGCGHNFCRECIKNVLETQLLSARFTCPECRAEFQQFPTLQKNVSLHNIAQHFLPDQKEHVAAEIFCTYCIQSRVPAVKSCLLCEASLCDDHLKVHSKSTEHILIEPITSTVNRRCSTHDKVLLYYCTEDASCVCVSCSLIGEHKGHQVETLNEAYKKMKESLRELLGNLTSKRQETKRSLQTLHGLKTDVPEKAVVIKDKVTTLFRDIRRQLDFLEKKVYCELSSQEEQVSLSVSDLMTQLEMKQDELSMEIQHIKELCNLTDPLTFLQTGSSCFPEMEMEDEIDILHSINGLDEGLIAASLYKGLVDIVTGIKTSSYVQADSDIFLDVDTAAKSLEISADLKFASCSENLNFCLKTAGRFGSHQVLSSRSFSSGQHYWEVETRNTGSFRVGVAYATIERQGVTSFIGNNDQSWALRRCKDKYIFYHDQVNISLPHKPSSQRLAIYLDYEAGQLSFYELSDPIRHLHTVKTTFTEPVHPGFLICDNCWLRILN